ncbi:hypothetical protein FQR65_LT17742 [Abscondita terminalis]|nr:hypothetical protein FQR65_LT17742 [Abscondita terminalis]
MLLHGRTLTERIGKLQWKSLVRKDTVLLCRIRSDLKSPLSRNTLWAACWLQGLALMYPDMVGKLILENPIGLEDWKLVAPYTTIDENYQNELKADYETTRNYQAGFYYDNNWKTEYDEWVYLLTGWTKSPDYP